MIVWSHYDRANPPPARTFALWFIPKRRRSPFVVGHLLGDWVREDSGSATNVSEPGVFFARIVPPAPLPPALDDAIDVASAPPIPDPVESTASPAPGAAAIQPDTPPT